MKPSRKVRMIGPFRGGMYSIGGIMGNVADTFKKEYGERIVRLWNEEVEREEENNVDDI